MATPDGWLQAGEPSLGLAMPAAICPGAGNCGKKRPMAMLRADNAPLVGTGELAGRRRTALGMQAGAQSLRRKQEGCWPAAVPPRWRSPPRIW
jgi:hypothetical protein